MIWHVVMQSIKALGLFLNVSIKHLKLDTNADLNCHAYGIQVYI